MSGTAPYYTQAFSPLPDRCFRLVSGGEGGGPTHCPEPPIWRGSWRAPNGRRYRVEACEGHRPPADKAGSRPTTLTRKRLLGSRCQTMPVAGCSGYSR
jgi:hypothetical protein